LNVETTEAAFLRRLLKNSDGSGGGFAQAAALAFMQGDLPARDIVERALNIAADICIYTNRNLTIEEL